MSGTLRNFGDLREPVSASASRPHPLVEREV